VGIIRPAISILLPGCFMTVSSDNLINQNLVYHNGVAPVTCSAPFPEKPVNSKQYQVIISA